MMQYKVMRSKLQGNIRVPPSKSHTLRAILFASLADGDSTIYSYLNSTDTQSMIEACRLLGAAITVYSEKLEVKGVGGKISYLEDVIHAGNSGIVLRFFTALGALSKHPVVITGDHSIRHQRPIKPLLDGLRQLGVSIASMRGDDYAPLIVQGPIDTTKVVISGEDSQYVSALLIMAAFASKSIEIEVKNPGEKPWVALTLDWFDRLGIEYEREGFEFYRMQGASRCSGFTYTVPSDWSSAAFPIVGALITDSSITIENLDMHDAQGDKEIIPVLQRMGASIILDEHEKKVHIQGGKKLFGTKIDSNNFVDAITILAVIGCFAEGETHIYNAEVARGKECNRIESIAMELQKMGADITVEEDGLRVRRSILHGNAVSSYNDHRMAMSLAIAAIGGDGVTTIGPVECVCKTFPDFSERCRALGMSIEEIEI